MDVAQMVEFLLWEQDVAGSSPVIHTKSIKTLQYVHNANHKERVSFLQYSRSHLHHTEIVCSHQLVMVARSRSNLGTGSRSCSYLPNRRHYLRT